jgi:hypothetical protein
MLLRSSVCPQPNPHIRIQGPGSDWKVSPLTLNPFLAYTLRESLQPFCHGERDPNAASREEPMKTFILSGFIVLAIAVAVYLFTSLQNVSRQLMDPKDLPLATFEVTKWTSDASAAAFILDDPAETTPIIVAAGLGKKEAMGLREPHEYLEQVGTLIQVYRIQNKKTGNAFGYVIAPARLEINAGYNILKQSVMILISDPEDSHHRRAREGGP